MTRKQKKMLRRILFAASTLLTAVLLPVTGVLRLLAYLLPYGIVG